MAGYGQNLGVFVIVLVVMFSRGIFADSSSCTRSLSRCDCTIRDEHLRTINCTNTGYRTDLSLGRLIDEAPLIESIIFTGNNLTSLSQNLFGLCPGNKFLNQLTYLDLSNNNIQVIHGKTFHCMPHLTTLKLNDNHWIVDPNKYRVLSSLVGLKALHLDNAFASKDHLIPLRKIFTDSDTPDIEELHLSRNYVSHTEDDIFCDLKMLTRLHMSDNRLSKVGLKPTCMRSLKELYLDNNSFIFLSQTDIATLQNMTSLIKLDIRNNPFECRDCTETMAKFRDWLIKSPQGEIVVEKDSLFCESPEELKGKDLMHLTNGNLEGTCDPTAPYYHANKQVAVIAVTMVFLGLVLIVVIVVIINRERIQKDGCWKPLREGTRGVLRRTLHFGYSTMENDTVEILEEEMCNPNA